MALNPLSNPSGDDDPEPMMEINTTPLIDVMLVLLVMLIITIPIQLHAVNIGLPVGPPTPNPEKPEVVRIDIDAQDVVHWQGEALADPAELKARLAIASKRPTPPEIHFRPAPGSHYDTLARAMAQAQQQGLVKLGVVDVPASAVR